MLYNSGKVCSFKWLQEADVRSRSILEGAMEVNLEYCPRCGKLFAKGFRDLCQACNKDIDLEYERCAEYLKKNRGITTQELSEATEVSVRQIARFIREGRISIANMPNMTYGCDSCGLPIREGHMCGPCKQRLTNDIRQQQTIDARTRKPDENLGSGAYQIKERE